ncbi:RDD domain-containing protein [Salinarchaeum sp. Harcht-Bsk1]|uniref:RDD family protein n=1 Tax=Salinarchaeum sp. Harcht-Bsk1 TaxID=1333523 RepID=UPI0003424320|nr:RDD family protein [Salinarchaeum sp. Harcht-Bsk1]AGN01291.1 RDD domain-containing protein [Salinarchaeum sp. Harcht-Bsk1]
MREDGELGGIGSRAVAVIVDTVVLFVVGYLIAMATGSTTGSGFALQGLPALLWFGAGFAYYIVLEAEYGQTPGKRLVGIEVVGEDGGPIDYQASVIRNVLRFVDALFFYLVGAILIWISDEGQRLGDRVGDTYVVKTQ